ncbi:flippase [Methanoculleus frigidifontis]|uniref:flippase n=1 Tax=Methanoculleus frigidifontis TaxID=2584085 RepID=UPI002657D19A|nr:flippase [Methanoculleus sp. FWC-SCC1]
MRDVVKNTLSLGFAEIVTKFLAFLLIVIVARYLGDAEFGKYSFAFAFALFVSILSDLGLSSLTIREIARRNDQAGEYFGTILIIKLALSIFSFTVLMVIINLMGYPSDTGLAVYLAGAYTILNSFNQFFRSIFRAFEKMEYELIVRIVEYLLIFALAMLFIIQGYGLIAIISAFLFGEIVCFVLSAALVVKRFTKPTFKYDLAFLRSIVTKALPFGLTAIFVVIYFKIDTVMLSLMSGYAVVGWYTASYNIIEGLTALVAGSVAGVLYPIYSRKFLHSEEHLKRIYLQSFQIMFIVGLLIALFVTFFSQTIVDILYGPEYAPAAATLSILIWAFFIICISNMTSTLLNAVNMQRIVVIGTGLGALVNVTLNLIFIPQYGMVGAAWATVITEVLGIGLYLYYSLRVLEIDRASGLLIGSTLKENVQFLRNLIKQ